MPTEINETTHPEGEDRAAAECAARLEALASEPEAAPAPAAAKTPKAKAAKTTKPPA